MVDTALDYTREYSLWLLKLHSPGGEWRQATEASEPPTWCKESARASVISGFSVSRSDVPVPGLFHVMLDLNIRGTLQLTCSANYSRTETEYVIGNVTFSPFIDDIFWSNRASLIAI